MPYAFFSKTSIFLSKFLKNGMLYDIIKLRLCKEGLLIR